ncbi:hypothetical protein LRA98_12830 [Halorhodospira sp. M38]|nr:MULTISPECIES: hypothetical protein [unclassified Halorhodospira]MCG5542061.1 hypothetical protein [Halorhodospira sp. M39old]MCG5547112.1 hypothetical protein [Halorhodospira sp. M38]
MFIRRSRSNGREYLRLVESYRDEQGRTRHRQVAQLGRADQPATQEKIEGLIQSLQRHAGMEGVDADGVRFDPARSLGPAWLLTELWQELGFDRALRRAFRSSYREFDLEAVVRLLVSTGSAIRAANLVCCAGSSGCICLESTPEISTTPSCCAPWTR